MDIKMADFVPQTHTVFHENSELIFFIQRSISFLGGFKTFNGMQLTVP
jgi:hypothetical protein